MNRTRPREVDHGLIGRLCILGKKEIGGHAFAAIAGVEGDLLADIVVLAQRLFDFGFKWFRIVAELIGVDCEGLVGCGFFVQKVAERQIDGVLEFLKSLVGYFGFDAPDSVCRRTVPWRLGEGIVECVGGIVPSTAEDHPVAAAARVGAPFTDVAGKIVGAVPVHRAGRPDGKQLLAFEVSQRHDVATRPGQRGSVPVIDRGEALAGPMPHRPQLRTN